jgi:ribonuclease R
MSKGRNLLIGRLTMHRDGFGFVIPEATSLDANLKARLAGDVFIPPHAIGSSMHGDRVLVEVSAVRTDGRAEGRIVRSLSRAHPTVVGIFHYGHRHNYVAPIDEKVTQEIVIPPGMEMPQSSVPNGPCGKDLAEINQKRLRRKRNPQTVSSATKQSLHDWQDLEGVVVDVEITDWPSATQSRAAASSKFSAKKNDFGVDVEIMIRKFHLPHRFPPEAIEEAQAIESDIPAEAPCVTAATTAAFLSSPSTEKPRAISTTPSTSANSKTATTNCKSTSPTSPNT